MFTASSWDVRVHLSQVTITNCALASTEAAVRNVIDVSESAICFQSLVSSCTVALVPSTAVSASIIVVSAFWDWDFLSACQTRRPVLVFSLSRSTEIAKIRVHKLLFLCRTTLCYIVCVSQQIWHILNQHLAFASYPSPNTRQNHAFWARERRAPW